MSMASLVGAFESRQTAAAASRGRISLKEQMRAYVRSEYIACCGSESMHVTYRRGQIYACGSYAFVGGVKFWLSNRTSV